MLTQSPNKFYLFLLVPGTRCKKKVTKTSLARCLTKQDKTNNDNEGIKQRMTLKHLVLKMLNWNFQNMKAHRQLEWMMMMAVRKTDKGRKENFISFTIS